jgi:hypothetical protein
MIDKLKINIIILIIYFILVTKRKNVQKVKRRSAVRVKEKKALMTMLATAKAPAVKSIRCQ